MNTSPASIRQRNKVSDYTVPKVYETNANYVKKSNKYVDCFAIIKKCLPF